MKNKSANPMMGRPKKQPSAKQLAEFSINRVLFEDVKKILIKSKVRGRWTYMDAWLLMDWFLWPESFDAIKTEVVENKPWNITYTLPLVSFAKNATVTRDHEKIYRALHLAKLFSQSPEELILALPKIQQRIAKFLTSPLGSMVFKQAINKQLGYEQMTKDFWSKSANELAGKDATARTVENARDRIRKVLSPDFSPKNKKKNG
jgi:hypothetical protein